MGRNRPEGPYVYYRCLGTDKYRHGGHAICANQSVRGTQLEELVWSDVCTLLKDPARLRRELERRLEQPPKDELNTAHLANSIAKLKQRMARLIDGYENGWIDKSDFEPRVRRVQERLAREEQALSEHEDQHASEDELRLLVGHFDTFAEQVADGLDQADFATKRKLLRLLIHRIEVDQDEVRIVYKVQPHPFVLSPAKRGSLQHCLKFQHIAAGVSPQICGKLQIQPRSGDST
jgi:site-specific DNA recombinase